MTTNKKPKQSDLACEFKSLLQRQKSDFQKKSIILTDAEQT